MKNAYAARTHKDMLPVLMDPTASGPSIHYHMIRGGSEKKNITVWEPGLVGNEYIKAYGHYHVGKLDETYTILLGEGIILLQTRKTVQGKPKDDEIDTFRAIAVRAGDSVFIPSGTGHLAVNTGNTWFVTSDDSPVNMDEENPVSMPGHADYTPFTNLKGAAYYVVKENGLPVLKRNPNYTSVPEARIERAQETPDTYV